MQKTSILFLQPREYFERLGLDFERIENECAFGFFSISGFLEDIKKYSVVVTCIDHSHFSRFLCLLAKANGVPSLIIMDGVFEWSNATSNPFLVKRGIKLLSPLCYSHAAVVDSGLGEALSRKGCKVYSYSPSSVVENELIQTSGAVLVTTANTPYFSEQEYVDLLSMLTEVIKSLENKNIDYAFRIFDERIIEDLSIPPQKNIIGGGFVQVVKDYGALITTPSTIAIEAMRLNLPVALLDYRDGPVFFQSAWRINGGSSISRTIDSLLSPSPERLDYQKEQLPPSKRLDEIIDDVSRGGYFRSPEVLELIGSLKKDLYTISFEYFARLFLVRKMAKFKGIKKALKKYFT